jgi:hypothetical protein
MSWSFYREFEGEPRTSTLGKAFAQSAARLLSPNATNAQAEENFAAQTGNITDAFDLTPGADIATKIKNLWQSGQSGKAVELLTNALHHNPDINSRVIDVSLDILSYFETHMPYEQNRISDIRTALQSSHEFWKTLDFNTMRDTLSQLRESLLEGEDGNDLFNGVKSAWARISPFRNLMENLSNDAENTNPYFMSEAQITGKMAAIQSLETWMEEQEQHIEALSPKQISWLEEQEEKQKHKYTHTFAPGFKHGWAA